MERFTVVAGDDEAQSYLMCDFIYLIFVLHTSLTLGNSKQNAYATWEFDTHTNFQTGAYLGMVFGSRPLFRAAKYRSIASSAVLLELIFFLQRSPCRGRQCLFQCMQPPKSHSIRLQIAAAVLSTGSCSTAFAAVSDIEAFASAVIECISLFESCTMSEQRVVVHQFVWRGGGNVVQVTGSFSGWSEGIALEKQPDGSFGKIFPWKLIYASYNLCKMP